MVKSVPGYEGIYEIDDQGTIWSLKHPRTGDRKALKICLNTKGYPHVKLYKNKKSCIFRTHRLVAQTFISNPDNKPQVNHRNGDKRDNRSINLEWCDNAYNVKYSFDFLGREGIKGIENYQAKLTVEDVKQIWYKLGNTTISELAQKYDVSITAIHYIAIGKNWGWLTRKLEPVKWTSMK